MLKLEESLVDENDRPFYPPRLIETIILNNPFSDITPRMIVQENEEVNDSSKTKTAAVNDFNLLSFGEGAEEDEEESVIFNKKFNGKGNSACDHLTDPKLSSQPAVEPPGLANKKRKEDHSIIHILLVFWIFHVHGVPLEHTQQEIESHINYPHWFLRNWRHRVERNINEDQQIALTPLSSPTDSDHSEVTSSRRKNLSEDSHSDSDSDNTLESTSDSEKDSVNTSENTSDSEKDSDNTSENSSDNEKDSADTNSTDETESSNNDSSDENLSNQDSSDQNSSDQNSSNVSSSNENTIQGSRSRKRSILWWDSGNESESAEQEFKDFLKNALKRKTNYNVIKRMLQNYKLSKKQNSSKMVIYYNRLYRWNRARYFEWKRKLEQKTRLLKEKENLNMEKLRNICNLSKETDKEVQEDRIKECIRECIATNEKFNITTDLSIELASSSQSSDSDVTLTESTTQTSLSISVNATVQTNNSISTNETSSDRGNVQTGEVSRRGRPVLRLVQCFFVNYQQNADSVNIKKRNATHIAVFTILSLLI
ncbi:Peptidyl-prolyl cis-trans isomerase CWC27 like protein [Eufriesea mexicana]|uniref:Peptidyl-prolyl cis-trans isomerase CWC27 like protein n=1 Tax=Eufriesea mexicana TaxID=516756 RepID=A0A310SH21_9HYME|nr:Peptidyl-prolyl cis-trans isomerase CWC27 like protein [Eufriesea mexicana]